MTMDGGTRGSCPFDPAAHRRLWFPDSVKFPPQFASILDQALQKIAGEAEFAIGKAARKRRLGRAPRALVRLRSSKGEPAPALQRHRRAISKPLRALLRGGWQAVGRRTTNPAFDEASTGRQGRVGDVVKMDALQAQVVLWRWLNPSPRTNALVPP